LKDTVRKLAGGKTKLEERAAKLLAEGTKLAAGIRPKLEERASKLATEGAKLTACRRKLGGYRTQVSRRQPKVRRARYKVRDGGR